MKLRILLRLYTLLFKREIKRLVFRSTKTHSFKYLISYMKKIKEEQITRLKVMKSYKNFN